MFGANKLIIKLAIIGAVAISAICIATTAGCGSVNGALAQKNTTQKSDDSIVINGGADAAEVITAKAAGKAVIVRAEKEPWRIIAYSVGIPLTVGLLAGLILAGLYIKAYLAQSPWDKTRKDRNAGRSDSGNPQEV